MERGTPETRGAASSWRDWFSEHGGDPGHDVHRALVTDGTPIGVGRRGRRIGLGRPERVGWDAEERPTPVEPRMPIAIAEESGMPDAHEARRQHMEHEVAEELSDSPLRDFPNNTAWSSAIRWGVSVGVPARRAEQTYQVLLQ